MLTGMYTVCVCISSKGSFWRSEHRREESWS